MEAVSKVPDVATSVNQRVDVLTGRPPNHGYPYYIVRACADCGHGHGLRVSRRVVAKEPIRAMCQSCPCERWMPQ